MWIKICANTNVEDALLAAELGADAVGFVFAGSKRQVTAQRVAEIVPHLPSGIEKIGVFVARDAAEIVGAVRATGLTGVQLHSNFDLALAKRLRAALGGKVSIIQTVHWEVNGVTNNALEVAVQLQEIALEPAIDRVLIDTMTAKSAGGTGVRFDWTAARETLCSFSGKLILAGGLRPENIAVAVDTLEPWGVDVASGVEATPGHKDIAKLRSFIETARRPYPR